MSGSHKPRGYTTVSPYLIVDGASRTIEFLTAAFDAVELRRFPGPDGTIMHAEVRIDDSVVMLPTAPPTGRRSPPTFTSTFPMSTRRTGER